jgi:hypothetical protein
MRNHLKRIKRKEEAKRASKIDTIRKTIQSLNNVSQSLPKILTATKDTEEGLEQAVTTLEDLRDKQFPMALKVAPYVNGALIIGSLFILKGIKEEIQNG